MVLPHAGVQPRHPAPDGIYVADKPETPAKTRAAGAGLALTAPHTFVHCMLFFLEYLESPNPRMQKHKRHLSFFFSRSGGFHLLLMLLNAYYNKPLAGRDPAWIFRGIRNRIPVSERALRMLINDGMAQGLIVQQHGVRDRRCRKYAVTPPVVEAWEALTNAARGSLPEIFSQFDPGALANADYRRWDPSKPACDQIETVPPSHRS